MVKLVLDDIYQVSVLEMELVNNGIPFTRVESGKQTPLLNSPFLLVNGVPLDFDRSIKWIKEQVRA